MIKERGAFLTPVPLFYLFFDLTKKYCRLSRGIALDGKEKDQDIFLLLCTEKKV